MTLNSSAARVLIGAGALAMCVLASTTGGAQGQAPAAPQGQPAPAGGRGFGGGGGRGGLAPALYAALDTNKDGCAARAEMKTAFDSWFAAADAAKAGAITKDQLLAEVTKAFASTAAAPAGGGGGRGGVQNQTPVPCDVDLMMAALPDKAPAKPAKPRKVLVLAKSAGFVHSSIPLAAKTVEALGSKTGAFAATITYDPADINARNLEQYDAVFLDNTTGCFLDDIADPAMTDARRKALMDFVRGGKGLAGIHAASDSYHTPGRDGCAPASGQPADAAARAGGGGRGARAGAPGAAGGAAAPGAAAPAVAGATIIGNLQTGAPAAAAAAPAPTSAETLVSLIMSQGDKNADQKLSRAEFTALTDDWFEKLDSWKQGKVRQSEFSQRFAAINPQPAGGGFGGGGRGGAGAAGGGAPVARGSVSPGEGTWPDFNKAIGGFFKYHWGDPQLITVKIDDPKSPLTAMFHGKEFEVHDETYTFAQNSFSRENVHVLTSVDYSKMSEEDKAKEPAGTARTDADYALSWIRREGQGRVFYEAHGHGERIYAMKPMLEHVLAGIQYALGDLKADDSPSVKK